MWTLDYEGIELWVAGLYPGESWEAGDPIPHSVWIYSGTVGSQQPTGQKVFIEDQDSKQVSKLVIQEISDHLDTQVDQDRITIRLAVRIEDDLGEEIPWPEKSDWRQEMRRPGVPEDAEPRSNLPEAFDQFANLTPDSLAPTGFEGVEDEEEDSLMAVAPEPDVIDSDPFGAGPMSVAMHQMNRMLSTVTQENRFLVNANMSLTFRVLAVMDQSIKNLSSDLATSRREITTASQAHFESAITRERAVRDMDTRLKEKDLLFERERAQVAAQQAAAAQQALEELQANPPAAENVLQSKLGTSVQSVVDAVISAMAMKEQQKSGGGAPALPQAPQALQAPGNMVRLDLGGGQFVDVDERSIQQGAGGEAPAPGAAPGTSLEPVPAPDPAPSQSPLAGFDISNLDPTQIAGAIGFIPEGTRTKMMESIAQMNPNMAKRLAETLLKATEETS